MCPLYISAQRLIAATLVRNPLLAKEKFDEYPVGTPND